MNARLQELQLLNLKDAEELDRCCLDLWNRSAMKSNLKECFLMSVRVIRQRLLFMKKTNLESMESESSITEGKIRKMQS